MLMNVKGFRSFSFISLFFITVLFISGCVQQYSSNGGIGGLVVYPGSVETNNLGMWASLTGFSNRFSEFKAYLVKGVAPSEIIDWYRSEFSDYGVEENTSIIIQGVEISTLILSKNDSFVGVVVLKQGSDSLYFVGKAKRSELVGEVSGESLPSEDLISGDEPLNRYPGSIMLTYSKEGDFPVYYLIEYGSEDSYEVVVNWWRSELTSQGWSVTSQSVSSTSAELSFEKDDDEVVIIVSAPSNSKDYTSISVSYTDMSMPSEDLVDGVDPVERYPGSVMVDYSKSSAGFLGTNSENVVAVYLVPAGLNAVKQWYLEKGGSLVGNSQYVSDEGDSIMISGMVDDRVVSLRVSFEEHVKYVKTSVEYSSVVTG